MDWNEIYTQSRLGTDTITKDSRSEFQRDFDRIIFNAGFRRMQNKTQVFPLPGISLVHNRLTHSLEVSSVGRSLGKIVGAFISKRPTLTPESKNFYLNELSHVIAAACLAHDIGNPPFGHSGEKAISSYFIENADTLIEGQSRLRNYFDGIYWKELMNFEGNANGLRFLTNSFNGKNPGGLRLTYTTLASILKYPCSINEIDPLLDHRKKFNYFLSEKSVFKQITRISQMVPDNNELTAYKRHPFVYLTEAADDICYKLIDLEDAQRLKVVEAEVVEDLFLKLIKCLKKHDFEKVKNNLANIDDINERISYLRQKCVNSLIIFCSDRFVDFIFEIESCNFNSNLMELVNNECSEMKAISNLVKEKVYVHPKVLKIEIAGYRVLYDLLELFIPAVLKEKPSHRDCQIINLIPKQFMFDLNLDRLQFSNYIRTRCVLDYFSGMTDEYALKLYKSLKGIEISSHE